MRRLREKFLQRESWMEVSESRVGMEGSGGKLGDIPPEMDITPTLSTMEKPHIAMMRRDRSRHVVVKWRRRHAVFTVLPLGVSCQAGVLVSACSNASGRPSSP